MSTNITFNGVVYAVPAYSDTGYAQGAGNLSAYLIAIASGCLQQTGGNFTLTSPVNFGASNGLLSIYYASRTANPASTGVVRLANATDAVSWRNFANSGDLPLTVNASNQLTFNGTPLASLITFNPNIVVVSNGAGALTSSTITTTELGYLSGVTSAIQTQINGKVAIAGDTMTGDLTMDNNKAIILRETTANGTDAVTVKAPASVTTSYSLNLPPAQGSSGQVMQNDGSGNLSWVANGQGTVGSGAQYQLPYYASAGTTLSAATNINYNASGDFEILNGKNLQLDGATSGNVKIKAAATTTSYSLTMPSSSTSGVLTNDGTGALSWGTAFNQYQKYTIGTVSAPYTGSLTVYDLPFTYSQDGKSLQVFYNGQQLVPVTDYTETSSSSITTTSPLVSGGSIAFRNVSAGVVAATATLFREDYVVGTPLNNYTGSTTVFNLVNSYTVGGNSMMVTLDGDVQTKGATVDYLETNSTTVTFNNALVSGQKVSFLWANTVGTTGVNAGTANQIAYYAASGGTVSGTSNGAFNTNGSSTWQKSVRIEEPETNTVFNGSVTPNSGALIIGNQAYWGLRQATDHSVNIDVYNAGTPGTALTIKQNGAVSIIGTSTNDSASAGFVGEYVSASVDTSTNSPATATWGDITSISLTAGDWTVHAAVFHVRNTATWSQTRCGLGTTSGNNAPNLGLGAASAVQDNTYNFATSSSTPDNFVTNVFPARVSISGTTTVYLKVRQSYSAGQAQYQGSIWARRVR